MSTTTNGHAQSGFGKLESVAGDAIGNHDLEAKGTANQVKGKAKEAVSSAQEAIGDAVGKARDAASSVKQAYEGASDKAQEIKGKVDPLVQEKPYLALLAAFTLGFVVSRLLAPGGPKVVYVKPRG